MKVIDVHTHMLSDAYLGLLKKHGGGYKVRKVLGGQSGIFKDGAPFMTLMPGMFDYELRIRAMDEAGVDIAIVTLTSPNVYWGSPRISLEAAKGMNSDMAAQQKRYPERIRFMCSLPWQHAKLAVAELRRACDELDRAQHTHEHRWSLRPPVCRVLSRCRGLHPRRRCTRAGPLPTGRGPEG